MLSLGIIGAGLIASETHIPLWLEQKDIKIKAVCDTNIILARKAALTIGNDTKWYNDAQVMFEKEGLDIVDICVPPQYHFSLAMLAVEHDCHIVLEKPAAQSFEETQKMLAAADQRNIKIFIIHQSIFNPAIVKAQNLINKGNLGDLTSVEITFLDSPDSWEQVMKNRNHWSHKLPGGHMFDALPHPLYIMLAFLGELNVEAVNTRKYSSSDWIIADDLYVLLRGKQANGVIHLGFNSPCSVGYIDIHGTKGNLRLLPFSLTSVNYKGCKLKPLPLAFENLSQGWQMVTGTARSCLTFFSKDYRGGHGVLIPKIIECIKTGSDVPVPYDDILEVMRALEDICSRIEAMCVKTSLHNELSGIRKI
jgi:predicted dehydrogenase